MRDVCNLISSVQQAGCAGQVLQSYLTSGEPEHLMC